MRFGWGLVGLLVVLAIMAVMVRKQLAGTQQALPVPVQQSSPADGKAATVPVQGRQIEQQVKQQVQTLTQPRPMPDEAQ
ncbi:MAG: hypothetical protein WBF97_05485 [Comamonas sp.]